LSLRRGFAGAKVGILLPGAVFSVSYCDQDQISVLELVGYMSVGCTEFDKRGGGSCTN